MNKWLVVLVSVTCLAWLGCRAQEETPDVGAPPAEVDVIEAEIVETPEGEVVVETIETPEGEVIEAEIAEDVPADVPAEAEAIQEEEEQE
ncbi:MAG: hypothetical protein JSU66_02885 [Deltaproteobacteria bacterium]|nr:MAG: hypothetical protein JSU66_02885 [Deltaproteobacteria bacterium]